MLSLLLLEYLTLLEDFFSEGTFNSAFVPSYISELNKGKKQANKFANNVFNFLILGLLFIVLIIEILMPIFVLLIAPGFIENGEKLKWL